MTDAIVTRFAPSPTGYMTIGNFRTALLSYLFARAHNGRFLLRFEDTDRQRSQFEYTDQMVRDLTIMGLNYDEECVWYQSHRCDIYNNYFDKLQEEGLLYRCYCTPEDLAIERKVQLASGHPPRYSGRCRHLSDADRARHDEAGTPYVLRFCVDNDWSYTVNDLLMGPKYFRGEDIGDFIVRKADGTPTFFFCNAIDDALSGVTHVLRGEDHLTNTPRQVALLQKLGLRVPEYAHFPMILGSDHKPLSKRNGSSSIKQLITEGYRPEAIVNYLARLGYTIDSQELLNIDEIAQYFDITKLARSAAHYDQRHLESWQKRAFQSLSQEQQQRYLQPHLAILGEKGAEFWALCHSQFRMPSDIAHWVRLLHSSDWELTDEQWEKIDWPTETVAVVMQNWGKVSWEEMTAMLKESGLQGARLFKPLRMLMTGQVDGPELPLLYAYIEPEIALSRIPEKVRHAITTL